MVNFLTGFTERQKAIVLERDGQKCPICGQRAREVNHRANRGSGGFLAGNRLSNACVICWICNGLIESDPEFADLARSRGVKLSRYADPLAVPYLHPIYGVEVWLDDTGSFSFDAPVGVPALDSPETKMPPATA